MNLIFALIVFATVYNSDVEAGCVLARYDSSHVMCDGAIGQRDLDALGYARQKVQWLTISAAEIWCGRSGQGRPLIFDRFPALLQIDTNDRSQCRCLCYSKGALKGSCEKQMPPCPRYTTPAPVTRPPLPSIAVVPPEQLSVAPTLTTTTTTPTPTVPTTTTTTAPLPSTTPPTQPPTTTPLATTTTSVAAVTPKAAVTRKVTTPEPSDRELRPRPLASSTASTTRKRSVDYQERGEHKAC
jgi:hypothetical protein